MKGSGLAHAKEAPKKAPKEVAKKVLKEAVPTVALSVGGSGSLQGDIFILNDNFGCLGYSLSTQGFI